MEQHSRRCCVFVAERGNVFMREIASWVVAGLQEGGYRAELCLSGVPQAASDRLNLVVAPHEYFELAVDPADRVAAARASIPVCTEQPGTPWFEIQMRSIVHSPQVFDINRLGVQELSRRGLDAHHLPLGYQRSFDRWGGAARERPIDVLFLGSLTDRREAVLAAMAPALQSLRCRFVLFEATRPARAGDPGFYTGAAKHELLASAKVLLNVHRGDAAYFESVRALEAVANGAVVLSEPCFDLTPFRAVDHVVTAPRWALGATCRALVQDLAWQEEVRRDAYAHVVHHHPLVNSLHEALTTLVGTASPPSARTRRAPLTPAPTRQAAPVTAVPAAGGVTDGLFKRVLLGQMQLRRRMDELECLVRHGVTRFDEVSVSTSFDQIIPDVSVVIPCYNYGRFVVEAIDSVASSVDVVPEIIVIEDHSDDGSSEMVRRYLATHDWVPLKLVTRHANGGLAAARNLGFELARAPFVFPLDADNSLYPHCLARLSEALLASGAAAAYGIAEVFHDRQGLLSALDWSVDRLVAGPYIDAAALIRKQAWEEAGGYAQDRPELFGWEDYDLWLNLADRGQWASFVPEILVRYRSHGGSMIHTTNIDTSSVAGLLRQRYRRLPWPEPAPV